jgi:hypothetical protein
MNRLLRVVLLAGLCVSPAVAQTGTVIFYSDAYNAKNTAAGLLPRSEQPYFGWLFDGPQRLAHVQPGRYLAFHLTAGEHSFTVPWHSKHPGKETLVIPVEAGGEYCVRLYTKMTDVFPVWQWLDSQMEEVPCQVAQQKGAHLKPIDIKRVDPAVRSELDAATTFPGSSQDQQ